MTGRELLIYISLIHRGEWDAMYKTIKEKRNLNIKEETIKEEISKINANIVTLIDEDYPSVLKTCNTYATPLVLYYKGDLSLTSNVYKRLTVVGSRRCSKYGIESVEQIVKELPNEVIIVSGLAKGIDTVALESALKSNKKVIAVIGNGIDFCYPEENKKLYDDIINKGGLIISEYPPQTPPEANNFRWRNRILAMLGDGLLIGEGKFNSGTKITAGFAINFNKNVGCIPHQIYERSICNELIKDGASLVENAKDAYELLN